MSLLDAKDYASLNVHMRAKRTELLPAGTYNLLAYATDYHNLVEMLASTTYKDILPIEDVKHPDLFDIDYRLMQFFVDQYNQYRKFIPRRSQPFVNAYSKIYFYNNVKALITALHGANNFEDVKGLLISLTDDENKEIDDLYRSKDVEDLISEIKDENLKAALDDALGEYRFLDLIYPLTIAIDQYFYRNLCQAMSKLKGTDRAVVKSLYGSKIDLQNIEIILRSKTFNIAPDIVRKWLITTEFCTLKGAALDRLINENDMETIFKIIRDETSYRDLANRLLDNIKKEEPPLQNFDLYSEQIMVHKANAIFRGASFNVAVFPAYFILKEIELRNIRTIILGKIDKRSTKEILDMIVLV